LEENCLNLFGDKEEKKIKEDRECQKFVLKIKQK
jgi:hypothetical protein